MTEGRMLSGYRAIEVGGLHGMFCGKLLGDLGVDVLRIEPPGGDPLRRQSPQVTWDGEPTSATWLAYNTSKRAVAIDVEQPAGRALLDRLLDHADILIASGSPAWLEEHTLLPDQARENRRRLVATAITPFGLQGPYRDYAITDLVAQAAGGFVYTNGDGDRPPVRISEEQTWPLAGSQAAFVTLAALRSAQIDGVGDSVDFSIQEAIVDTLVSVIPWWQMEKRNTTRSAMATWGRDIHVRMVWPCKGGFVCYRLSVGATGGPRNLNLIHWMDEEGMAGDLLSVPWGYISTLEVEQSAVAGWQATIERFFATKTKEELYAGALKRRIMIFPVLELSDILQDEQLLARGFFTTISDASGQSAKFPGAFFRAVPGADPMPTAPPGPGADTESVLETLAGCDRNEVERLRAAGVAG